MEPIGFGDAPVEQNGQRNTLKAGQLSPFGQLPAWVVKSGLWRVMTFAQKAVYVALVYFADNSTGWVHGRTWKDIAEVAGVAVKTIGQITDALHSIGAIHKKASRNWASYRVLRTPPDDIKEKVKFLSVLTPTRSESHRRDQSTQRFAKREANSQTPSPLVSQIPR